MIDAFNTTSRYLDDILNNVKQKFSCLDRRGLQLWRYRVGHYASTPRGTKKTTAWIFVLSHNPKMASALEQYVNTVQTLSSQGDFSVVFIMTRRQNIAYTLFILLSELHFNFK